MTPEEHEHEYELLMPFVVVRSKGGPYDDDAFVAGAHMAGVDARCGAGEDPVEAWVPPPLVPQIDLVAMRHGYSMESEPWDEHPDEWSRVRLTRTAAP